MRTLDVQTRNTKGSIFSCCWMTVKPFCCPNKASECKSQCWWHYNGTVMLMLMWSHHPQLGHPQGRLCPKSAHSDWQFWRYHHFCVPPMFFWSDKHLKWCQFPLHQLWHLTCLPHLSFIKPPSVCHSPHMTGTQLTRCASLDCSSASLILNAGFARSRLRNTWTTYSASWARKVMQP